uniref:Glucuronosyltransferase n=1 Tax=Rhabditophanes sp. KR3021 TaxID=114890 RepID=A0AC35TGY8_9BILA
MLILWENLLVRVFLLEVYNILTDILVRAGLDVTCLMLPLEHDLKITGTKLAKVITLEDNKDAVESSKQFDEFKSSLWVANTNNPLNFLKMSKIFKKLTSSMAHHVLSNETLIEYIKKEKFDLGITESLDMFSFGLFKVFNIDAYVSMFAGGLFSSHYKNFGLAYPVSQVPTIHAGFGDHEMDLFGNRFKNFVSYHLTEILSGKMTALHQDIFDEKYGKGFVDIEQQFRDSSFHISNADEFVDFTTPRIGKIVQVGGFSIEKAKPVSEEWATILRKRKYNILVSFGTNCKSVDMPLSVKTAFLETFAAFPDVTFIWKYENPKDGTAKNLPNVYLSEYLPQTDILADDLLTAFITHGGLNSISEAAHTGKKLLVIPLFADQYRNSKIAEKIGFGITLYKDELVTHKLSASVKKLLEDKDLARNSKRIGDMIRNRPYNSTQLFINSVEFAAKFGKLPHLNMQGQSLYWFQFQMFDIWAVILFTLALVIFIIGFIIVKVFRKCFGKKVVVSIEKKSD